MTIEDWLKAAIADAERRGLPELKPLLESAGAGDTALLASAGFGGSANGSPATRVMPLTIDEFAPEASRAANHRVGRSPTSACERIDADNPRLNAFILVMADEARRQAREADRELAAGDDRGPLHGVPISIKDLFDIARHADDRGVARPRRARRQSRRAGDRAAAQRRRGASSARPTCTSSRSARRTRTRRSGPRATRSIRRGRPAGRAADRRRASSAGMALATIGTDTGGSIRIPAAACGIGRPQADVRRDLDRRRRAAVADARSRRPARRRRVADAWPRAITRCAATRAADRSRRRRSAGCALACRAGTSAICSTTKSGERSRRRSMRLRARRRDESTTSTSRTPRFIATIYLHIVLRRCRGRITPPRSRRCRNATRRPSGCGSRWRATCSPRITCGRSRDGTCCGAKSTRRCPARRAGAADAADSGAADRRQHRRHRRIEGTGPQRACCG